MSDYIATLTTEAPAFEIEVITPTGTFLISGGLAEPDEDRPDDTALVVWIDPQDIDPDQDITGDIVRVNVAEAMVFGYSEAEMALQS